MTDIQTLVAAFENMIVNLEEETDILQSASTFSIPKSEKLLEIERKVNSLEENLDAIEDFIFQETNSLEKFKALNEQSRIMFSELESMDQFPKPESRNIESANPLLHSENTKPVSENLLISLSEFESTSKVTKGRLTINLVNDALLLIIEMAKKKEEVHLFKFI